MAYNRLCDSFGLGRRRLEVVLKKGVSQHTAVELEAHLCGRDVLIGCADVVKEAGEEVSFGAKVPIGELLREDRLAWRGFESDFVDWTGLGFKGGMKRSRVP